MSLESEATWGQTSCRERVERCLQRIDETEDQIRAWVVVDRERALHQAELLDAQPVTTTTSRSKLRGLVLGVKDIIDVAGFPTRCGLPDPADCATTDAPLVSALRAAGAVILGKTVTTAHAFLDPPPTRNPHKLDRTPGGSSSGSAAAVAAGHCEAAIGTQTGGSLVRPASFCGVAVLKPSYGVLTTDGIRELARTLDHPGFLASSVTDLAILLGAIHRSVPDPLKRLTPRIGRIRGFGEDRVSDLMNAALDDACDRIRDQSLEILDLTLPPDFQSVHEAHYRVMSREAALVHQDDLKNRPERYPPRIRKLILDGLEVDEVLYGEALKFRNSLIRSSERIFQGNDILVMPSAPGEAPDVTSTGDPWFNAPWSFLGYPVVGLPLPISSAGLPLGLQLIGRPGTDTDGSLLGHALEIEKRLADRTSGEAC